MKRLKYHLLLAAFWTLVGGVKVIGAVDNAISAARFAVNRKLLEAQSRLLQLMAEVRR